VSNSEFDIAVIGAGLAGLTAGLTAARLGRSVLIVTGDLLGGHLLSVEKVEGYPGFPEGVPGYELCPMAQVQAVDAGAEISMANVQAVAPRDGAWGIDTNGENHSAGAVILATGTRFRRLGVAGEDAFFGKGVSTCASCDAPLLQGKTAVVIGGGDSAAQEALTLAPHVSGLTVLVRGEAMQAQSAYQDRLRADGKVEIRYNAEVDEIQGEDAVARVRVRDSANGAITEIDAEGVFVFVGLQPNTEFLNGILPLTETGHIPTDPWLRTTRPGLFAAGSVRADNAGQAVAAAGDGAAAALAAHEYLVEGSS
jgi:thioredoxin reductase (NADPH)